MVAVSWYLSPATIAADMNDTGDKSTKPPVKAEFKIPTSVTPDPGLLLLMLSPKVLKRATVPSVVFSKVKVISQPAEAVWAAPASRKAPTYLPRSKEKTRLSPPTSEVKNCVDANWLELLVPAVPASVSSDAYDALCRSAFAVTGVTAFGKFAIGDPVSLDTECEKLPIKGNDGTLKT
jgi:hypothetical protein